jgi:hypothetical protein
MVQMEKQQKLNLQRKETALIDLEQSKQKIAKVKNAEKKVPIIKFKSSVLERLNEMEKKNQEIKDLEQEKNGGSENIDLSSPTSLHNLNIMIRLLCNKPIL